MNPVLGIMAVGGAVAAWITVIRLWQRAAEQRSASAAASAHAAANPELPRKAVHIGIGLIALLFPWLFTSPWPVWVIAALSLVFVASLRIVPSLRNYGRVLSAVERVSLGDLCFPLGVAALFTLARGDPALYIPPVLVLTFADAAAAIVGRRYGADRYSTLDGYKSLQGSAAFFLAGFLAVAGSLLVLSDIDPLRAALIGLLAGILLTLIEAIAWRGLDNFFIPIGGYVLLDIYLAEPGDALLLRLVVLAALAAVLWRLRPRITLLGDGLIAACLAVYIVWVLGGWVPAATLLTVLAGATRIGPTPLAGTPRIHTAAVVLAALWPTLLCLAAPRIVGDQGDTIRVAAWFGLWASLGALATLVANVRIRFINPDRPRAGRLLVSCTFAAATVLPWWALFAWRTEPSCASASLGWMVAAAVLTVLAAEGEDRLLPPSAANAHRWLYRSACIAIGASLPALTFLGTAA